MLAKRLLMNSCPKFICLHHVVSLFAGANYAHDAVIPAKERLTCTVKERLVEFNPPRCNYSNVVCYLAIAMDSRLALVSNPITLHVIDNIERPSPPGGNCSLSFCLAGRHPAKLVTWCGSIKRQLFIRTHCSLLELIKSPKCPTRSDITCRGAYKRSVINFKAASLFDRLVLE